MNILEDPWRLDKYCKMDEELAEYYITLASKAGLVLTSSFKYYITRGDCFPIYDGRNDPQDKYVYFSTQEQCNEVHIKRGPHAVITLHELMKYLSEIIIEKQHELKD